MGEANPEARPVAQRMPNPVHPRLVSHSQLVVSTVFSERVTTLNVLVLVPLSTSLLSLSTLRPKSSSWPVTPPVITRRPVSSLVISNSPSATWGIEQASRTRHNRTRWCPAKHSPEPPAKEDCQGWKDCQPRAISFCFGLVGFLEGLLFMIMGCRMGLGSWLLFLRSGCTLKSMAMDEDCIEINLMRNR